MRARTGRAATVASLGAAQTLAWASSFYLPAVLAAPMAVDLGVGVPTVFAAFSFALVVAAGAGAWAGRAIDRWGGRPVLMGTNLVFAAGLALLAAAEGLATLLLAWAVLGLAMGAGLYEAAFAALVRLHGRDARNLITGITLVAGFASTVGWPLSGLFEAHFGWRGACMAWAALHLVLGLPLNALLPGVTAAETGVAAGARTDDDAEADAQADNPAMRRDTLLVALVLAASLFIGTAMAAHLPALLQLGGATAAGAIAIAALVGPAQVAGRLLEFGVLQRVHPLLSARLAALMHPLGAVALALTGAPAAVLFALLHGAGNGIMTIAKGTLPLALFGPRGYGRRQGLIMVPARVAQAMAPWLFGLALQRLGASALWLSAALGLGVFAALLALRAPTPQGSPAARVAVG